MKYALFISADNKSACIQVRNILSSVLLKLADYREDPWGVSDAVSSAIINNF
jgi:hypothetical protein